MKRDHTSLALIIAVSGVRMLTGVAIVKVLSSIFGPADFGVISHVMAIAALFYMIAGGGAGAGLILNVGKSSDDTEQSRWLAAALEIAIASAVLLGVLAFIVFVFGGRAVLGDRVPPSMIFWIAATQALVGFGNVLSAYASGVQNVKAFAAANIGASMLAAALIIATSVQGHLHAAVWAAIVAPVAITVLASPLLYRPLRQSLTHLFADHPERRGALLKAAGYGLLCVATLPLAAWFIRTDFARRLGWDAVGQWQAVARLSDAYMQVFGVLVVNYIFPKFVAARAQGNEAATLASLSVQTFALFAAGAGVLYLVRKFVILLAYSPAFLPAADQIPLQLLGDAAKVGIWLLMYALMASGRLWVQPLTEFVQALVFVFAYWLLMASRVAMAPVAAHALACALVAVGLLIIWSRTGGPNDRTAG